MAFYGDLGTKGLSGFIRFAGFRPLGFGLISRVWVQKGLFSLTFTAFAFISHAVATWKAGAVRDVASQLQDLGLLLWVGTVMIRSEFVSRVFSCIGL